MSESNVNKICLGKATRRGVKKCPNCGFTNGTRGFMCKNPMCCKVFKDSDKRKVHLDSVKLVTGTARQVYSVRVKDKGPENRGFVQLPVQGNKAAALCFVESCQRLFDNSILKCHEGEEQINSTCVHIASALKSYVSATVLDFNHNLISSLGVDEDCKKRLCLLAKSCDLVQKVSQNVFAVKCTVTATNPLGYLHLIFGGNSEQEANAFSCDCNSRRKGIKCVHYYACVVAFISDSKFATKYQSFIQAEFETVLDSGYEYNLVNVLGDLNKEVLQFEVPIYEPFLTTVVEEQSKRKSDELLKPAKRKAKTCFDELTFIEWLSSAVEQINMSLSYDYQMEVCLKFNIHTRFYELLKERITTNAKCTHGTDYVFREEFPRGRCMVQSLHISKLSELRNIFATDAIKMRTSRSFVLGPNGGFVEFLASGASKSLGKRIEPAQIVTQLLVDEKTNFTIQWYGTLYKVSQFGELRFVFRCEQRAATKCR